MCKGAISEIFFSFQGEGIYLGEPQIFVRLAGCNLQPRCRYCDTKINTNRTMTSDDILYRIEKEKWPAKFISITGGEPLIQAGFLSKLLPRLQKKGFRIYLETNGTLPDAMGSVAGNVDIVSMDIKLPSSGRTRACWERHSRFLNICKKKEVMVKVVVTGDTERSDIEKAVGLMEKIPHFPFILQPVTSNGKVKCIGYKRLKEFYRFARQRLGDVRIIPQVHRIFDIK